MTRALVILGFTCLLLGCLLGMVFAVINHHELLLIGLGLAAYCLVAVGIIFSPYFVRTSARDYEHY